MRVESFAIGPLQTNSYLIFDQGKAVAIDVGGDPNPMLGLLAREKLALSAILLTHAHFDHAYGVAALAKATGAPVYLGSGEKPILETELGRGGMWGFPPVQDYAPAFVEPGDIDVPGFRVKALLTPGHTPGSLSYWFPDAGAVFSGDVLFYRSIGRTDFPGGDLEALLNAVRRELFALPKETVVYSGHGPATTVGDEELHNPYFNEGF